MSEIPDFHVITELEWLQTPPHRRDELRRVVHAYNCRVACERRRIEIEPKLENVK